MPRQTHATIFRNREDAERDQANRGQIGYSERYPRGIDEVKLTDGTIGYRSNVEEYYG